MKTLQLGTSGLKVSQIGLGTMTWGEQNSEQEAFTQLDYAIAHGINFIDTAEMYPVPPKAETQGLTEQYIGNWLHQRGKRDDVIIATKAAGPARDAVRPSHLRNGNAKFDRPNLTQALHDSLSRLQTDYIDLYQLHWPDRSTNYFGRLDYEHVANEDTVAIDETLDILQTFIQQGKIRAIGVSNETPWGIHRFLTSAERGLPRIASIQNPYNLLNRVWDIGLAEISLRENIPLLAYSPLAFGTLSGKYLNGQRPEGARLSLFDRFNRYHAPAAERAIQQYVDLAESLNITPAQLALAFVNQRPYLGSNLIGATNIDQLKENISSLDIELNHDTLKKINEIHLNFPNPCP